jgi:hypothetical protein
MDRLYGMNGSNVEPTKKAVLVGTAGSWKEAPFDDPSAYIVSLNDAYMLKLPRVDEWSELHPIDKMVDARAIPPGHYVRPEGHIEWLRKQAETIPVWLQSEPPAGWPVNAKRFPIEEIEAKYGQYWASGPAYMLAHLYERGFRHIEIYGIHLATEHEYREQRPQFENLLGSFLGPHRTERREGEKRIYEGNGFTLVLPVSSPIMQHGWKYAYQPKPQPKPTPYRDELARTRSEKDQMVRALVHWPAGKDKSEALEQLRWLEVIEADCIQQLQKLQFIDGAVSVAV